MRTAGRNRLLNEPRTRQWSFLLQPVDPTLLGPDIQTQLDAIRPEGRLPCPLQHETRSPVPLSEPSRLMVRPYLPIHRFFSLRGPFHNGDCKADSGHMAHNETASRTHLLHLRFYARVLRQSRCEVPYGVDSVPERP